ncbi:MAG: phosphate acyltransferase PlsX [Chitinophagaceae bacterium]
MNIGIDLMGGDFAPAEALKGIQRYLEESAAPAHLYLFGDEALVNSLLATFNLSSTSFTIVDAPQTIGMQEHPTKALKEKPKSSISVGFSLLASGQIDALISAGNTGAMMVGALYSLKPIEGVLRPTISTLVPKANGGTGLLLDVGLNSDCKPEHLNQFAVMGSIYAESILGITHPRVGLLNIGEEEGKGNLLAQSTFPLLKENKQINFIGNVEGRDLLRDKADVVVCDGFTGNIILKLAESLYEINGSNGSNNDYFDRLNFEDHGGTPVLGISKPVIIGHGISKGKAFKNMILLAQKMIETKVLEKLQMGLEA